MILLQSSWILGLFLWVGVAFGMERGEAYWIPPPPFVFLKHFLGTMDVSGDALRGTSVKYVKQIHQWIEQIWERWEELRRKEVAEDRDGDAKRWMQDHVKYRDIFRNLLIALEQKRAGAIEIVFQRPNSEEVVLSYVVHACGALVSDLESEYHAYKTQSHYWFRRVQPKLEGEWNELNELIDYLYGLKKYEEHSVRESLMGQEHLNKIEKLRNAISNYLDFLVEKADAPRVVTYYEEKRKSLIAIFKVQQTLNHHRRSRKASVDQRSFHVEQRPIVEPQPQPRVTVELAAEALSAESPTTHLDLLRLVGDAARLAVDAANRAGTSTPGLEELSSRLLQLQRELGSRRSIEDSLIGPTSTPEFSRGPSTPLGGTRAATPEKEIYPVQNIFVYPSTEAALPVGFEGVRSMPPEEDALDPELFTIVSGAPSARSSVVQERLMSNASELPSVVSEEKPVGCFNCFFR